MSNKPWIVPISWSRPARTAGHPPPGTLKSLSLPGSGAMRANERGVLSEVERDLEAEAHLATQFYGGSRCA